ncbi:MAG: DUF885 family protein, partial [Lachnospiraceae bacterium]|nr:DUF885 family protein [Lachnospiraceae bacterium]
MKRHLSYFISVLLSFTLVLSSCGYERIEQSTDRSQPETSNTNRTADQDFEQFCMEVFREEMITADTIDLHYTLTKPDTYGIQPAEISLGSCSLEDMIRDHQLRKDLQNQLSGFDRSALSDNWQLTYDALSEMLDSALMAEGMELYEQPLAPTIGVQAQLPILLAEYAFQSLEDVETYLELLSQMDQYYQEIMCFENQKADAGLAPSDVTIDNIIASCESYLIDPENNFLTETFAIRLAGMEEISGISLTDTEKANLENRHVTAIRDHFIPAYQLLIDGMSAMKGRGLNESGLCGSADG